MKLTAIIRKKNGRKAFNAKIKYLNKFDNIAQIKKKV